MKHPIIAFQAQVIPSGNATAVEIPAAVVAALEAGARPLIAITINGHTWRSRVALMHGRALVGISAANRAASGIAAGDVVAVTVERDDAPRVVSAPPDLAAALDAEPEARAAFDKLPYGLRRKEVAAIEEAKSAQTRQHRIARLVAKLRSGG